MLKAEARFDDLKSALSDQETFGKFVQDLIDDFDLGYESTSPDEEDNQDDESQENEEEQEQDQSPDSEQEDQPGQTEVTDADAMEDDSAEPQDMVDAENIEGDQDESDQTPDANAQQINPVNMPDPYDIYTNTHDETIKAEELCDAEELERLRGYLDGHIKGLSGAISRLANRLQRRLLAQQQRS